MEAYDDSLEKLKQSFKDFCLKTPFQGRIFANGDSPEVLEVTENLPRNVSLFGFSANNDFQILNFMQDKDGSNFVLFDKGQKQ